MQKINLDTSKLLGFRLTATSAIGAKVGDKLENGAAKIGAKVGNKPPPVGARIGAKIGLKNDAPN